MLYIVQARIVVFKVNFLNIYQPFILKMNNSFFILLKY